MNISSYSQLAVEFGHIYIYDQCNVNLSLVLFENQAQVNHPKSMKFKNSKTQQRPSEILETTNQESYQRGSSGLSKAACLVTIEGLTIEGALFDGHNVECSRDSPSNCAISNCSVAWIPAGKGGKKDNLLETPVYYNSLREHQVTSIKIPCPGSTATWKLKSVALILKNQ